jgi:hypothetical protein
LIFKKDDLINEQVFQGRQIRIGSESYSLIQSLDYLETVQVIRVGDKMTDTIKTPKEIKSKMPTLPIDYHTFPEFEMLFIVNERQYDNYISSHRGPKEYAKEHIALDGIKYDGTSGWIIKYFSKMSNERIIALFDSYKRVCGKAHKGERLICDLIKR